MSTTPDAEATVAVHASGLVKRFGDTHAVQGIDLLIPRGSFFGIVGPNGAGKTTTLSMMTGHVRPDSGGVRLFGIDVWQQPLQAKHLVGVFTDETQLFTLLSGRQLVVYAALLHGLSREVANSRADDLLHLFGLAAAADVIVGDYSAGMTKKIGIATALVHAPKLLILDEPFEAVDPVSAANIRDVLGGFVANGGTVLLSSHSMELVERMCDRVALIDAGQVKAVGTLDEVRAGLSLEERFVQLVGGRTHSEGPSWLLTS